MNKTFDQGKDEIAKLCHYFATNRQSYLGPAIKEAHVRQSLIDPFFEALGWDVANRSMIAPQYREVIPEDSLDIEGQQKAPDYTFRVGTLPKFYVEAKKCGINISADPAPAYQLRRYGFSAKLPLSILTDFEELGVYDCASRPRPGEKASHARILYFSFTEYPDRWEEIWDVFSREAVWSGKFDQYAASKRKRGTSEVDTEFLKDIEGWRDKLARNLALRNNDLSADELNAAVQRIIDRIVFLRMAEDRGLESYGQLLRLCEQPDIYARFMKTLCRKADEKYNSGLFHFQKEPGVSDAPDTLTPQLAVDDKVFKSILQSLYFEYGSPYNFGVMPVEILGTVYERFLGKVIRLTAGHQAKVEEKPEVRKAGGVYYTPAYIVDYIVQNTVGKQIEGKSPAILAGDKATPPFRVLDMACGSGSFLLGAYQFLLDHCLKWYQDNPSKKHDKAVYQNAKGEIRLTVAERKRILTTHIFGVDIDPQAVETTKLSLLLKAMEGENDTTLAQQMRLFQVRALPNLSDNIKCGNSLIASDFSIVPEDLVRVRAFDWDVQFPDAMKAGGFDAVIGNPPWGCLLTEQEKHYLFQNYVNRRGEAESHLFFIERGHRLIKETGMLGFITPNTWLSVLNSREIREYLLTQSAFSEICELSKYIFADAPDIVPILVFVGKKPISSKRCFVRRSNATKVHAGNFHNVFTSDEIDQTLWLKSKGATINLRATDSTVRILTRAVKIGIPLRDLCDVTYGIKTGDNATFVSRSQSTTHKAKALKTGELVRYQITWKGFYLWWCTELAGYRISSLEVPKIIVQYIRKLSLPQRLIAALDEQGIYYPLNNYSYITMRVTEYSLLYILGIINSALINFYFANTFIDYNIKPTYIQQLPIRPIHFTNPPEKELHNRLVALVAKMLTLTSKLREATSASEKAALQNAVTTTNAQIDRLVYELYGLTDEEIKIVESAP